MRSDLLLRPFLPERVLFLEDSAQDLADERLGEFVLELISFGCL